VPKVEDFDLRRYATICKSLRELFERAGKKPPLILLADEEELTAYHIDEVGYVHNLHRELSWNDEGPDFIHDSMAPPLAPDFIDDESEQAKAIQR
jgi:hypothetical protein